jgi:hypothetical protein
MSCSRVLLPLLLGAMMAAALPAYSQQPTSSAPPANTPPPAAASAATTTTTTTATAAAPAQTSTPAAAQTTASDSAPAKPSEEMVKKAKSLGLHAEVRKGVTVYCWKNANTGSLIATEKCVDQDQLDDMIRQRQAVQDEMRQMTTPGAIGSK